MKYRMASYELCGLAVVAFLIDHVGEYFYDDNQWFRIFRLFGLVWFFPAGYNSAWRISRKILVSIFILTVLDSGIFTTFLPVTALATLVLARLFVEPVMEFAMKSRLRFWGMQAALVALVMPTAGVVEYGTLALIIAIGGWLVRHRDRLPKDVVSVPHYFVFMTAIYLAYSQYTFAFNAAQLVFVTASTIATAWVMYHFTDLLREDLARKKLPEDGIRRACRFISHHTLEIYVGHLVLFKLIMLGTIL